MSTISRTTVIQLYPTHQQRRMIDTNFFGVRFVWNQLAEEFNNTKGVGKLASLSELKSSKKTRWLSRCVSQAIQVSYKQFEQESKQNISPFRKMMYKKKGQNDSITVPMYGVRKECNINYSKKVVKIVKVGEVSGDFGEHHIGVITSAEIFQSKNKIFLKITLGDMRK